MGHMRRKYKGRHHAWLVRALVRRDGATCGVCGESFASMREITLDHRVAKSRGGTDDVTNLQLAHDACNQAKGALSVEEWAELQGRGLVEA